MVQHRKYLRVPRDAHFPTLPLPEHFEEYAHAYYLAAKHLWDAVPKSNGVPCPDNLVHPILFLIHQCMELHLKGVIVLSYSIGSCTGELIPKEIKKTHDLTSLLTLADQNLSATKAVLKPLPITVETRDFIEDLNKFGLMGEALRYPYHTVNAKAVQRMVGTKLPDSIIPDVPAVMKKSEKAEQEIGSLVSFLVEYDQKLFEAQIDAYS